MRRLGELPAERVLGYRAKLLVAIMVVVSVVTMLALFLAQRSLAATVEEDLERAFETELAALHLAQAVRLAGLVERCRILVRKPRLRAVFEDDALDLLYLTAEDELRDVVVENAGKGSAVTPRGLHAGAYWFLDRRGVLIQPPDRNGGGGGGRPLAVFTAAQISLPRLAHTPQVGYLAGGGGRVARELLEIIAVPILSSETGEAMAALVLGFLPPRVSGRGRAVGLKSGIWVGGRLEGGELGQDAVREAEVRTAVDAPVRVMVDGVPYLLFSKMLNADSLYARAFEVCLYPLTDLWERQRILRWQVLGAGGVLLLLGLVGSHVVSGRLARPVEQLASDSAEERKQRMRVEAALEVKSADLQRSARFSADASHQLKTPVAVLRAGLEELLAQEKRPAQECEEISALIHQTYRLSSVIDDLLLLSRMDAGRLQLSLVPVNLSELLAAGLDDLSTWPEDGVMAVEAEIPAALFIAGEQRYTAMILQNLLENARKYNCAGGRIRISVTVEDHAVRLGIGNTGRTIPPHAQSHIFERFHRGEIGENVPGYGLGLNLARELARLHRGDLRLLQSADSWTEFEVCFQLALLVQSERPSA